MKSAKQPQTEALDTVWRPGPDLRELLLAAILHRNPIPIAYRLNYLANFYVGPLVAQFAPARPEPTSQLRPFATGRRGWGTVLQDRRLLPA